LRPLQQEGGYKYESTGSWQEAWLRTTFRLVREAIAVGVRARRGPREFWLE
jgi:hypothetical protein